MKIIQITHLLILTTMVSCNNRETAEVKHDSIKVLTENFSYPVLATNKKESQGEGDTLYAALNNMDFIIYPNGQINQFERGDKKAGYKLHNENVVEKVFLCFYKGNLIVYYSDTDFDTGASFIESFSTKTQKRQWRANAHGFNLGRPVNKGNLSYISTIGFVGKLNLLNGQYLWQHSNLYDRATSSFNYFDSTIFRAANTLFISKNDKDKSVDTVAVNDKTGFLTIRK